MPQVQKPAEFAAVDGVDSRYLQTLIGYNARRASLAVIELFHKRMAVYGLRPVEFSVLSLIVHNPGITSRQLCAALRLLPPNLVSKISSLEKRFLVERQAHPQDGRAVGLHATVAAITLMQEAERTASRMEDDVAASLSASDKKTLIRLLQKLYVQKALNT